MFNLQRVKRWCLGAPQDPLDPVARKHLALAAFLAWIGLGADGLSSSCYGPSEAYIALGVHVHLALYLAIATFVTVFVISFAYNQVMELFPTGGGGYKVATHLLSPIAGVVSGSALLVDYALTIAISIASAMDALFSLLPPMYQIIKLDCEYAALILLLFLNLRGMKESIRILLPIFLGFVVVHAVLIVQGIWMKHAQLPNLFSGTWDETVHLGQTIGWTTAISLFLRAYSLGGGTYTGLEAVSNNVHTLAEPRVKTGKWTMFYMALSLSFTAGGLIFIYLLWHVVPDPSKTLNAVVFGSILDSWPMGSTLLILVLLLEAGLLVVGANTGFLGGPQVLANMAVDGWVPKLFSQLSNRLVAQNGIVVFGLSALAVLFLTGGDVSFIVVLYSINVFLTFSLSILGLCVYGWKNRAKIKKFRRKFIMTVFSGLLTFSILLITIYEKFLEGGWVTILVTGLVVGLCFGVRQHYRRVANRFKEVDAIFGELGGGQVLPAGALLPDPAQKTAVIFVGKSKGSGIHTLLWINRLFPDVFKNFIFASVGVVDSESFSGGELIRKMQSEVGSHMAYYMDFCRRNQLRATHYERFGVDTVQELIDLSENVKKDFPNVVFFASKMIFEQDNWWIRVLHDQVSEALQRELHLRQMQMVILPMKI